MSITDIDVDEATLARFPLGPKLWLVCDDCNYQTHRCPACGDDLTHAESRNGVHIRLCRPDLFEQENTMTIVITLGDRHALVADAHEPVETILGCENVFQACNRIYDTPTDMAAFRDRHELAALREGLDVDMAPSMSVGDQIHVYTGDGFWQRGWLCDADGWRELGDSIRQNELLQERHVHFLV